MACVQPQLADSGHSHMLTSLLLSSQPPLPPSPNLQAEPVCVVLFWTFCAFNTFLPFSQPVFLLYVLVLGCLCGDICYISLSFGVLGLDTQSVLTSPFPLYLLSVFSLLSHGCCVVGCCYAVVLTLSPPHRSLPLSCLSPTFCVSQTDISLWQTGVLWRVARQANARVGGGHDCTFRHFSQINTQRPTYAIVRGAAVHTCNARGQAGQEMDFFRHSTLPLRLTLLPWLAVSSHACCFALLPCGWEV